MTYEEAKMQIQAIPGKIWDQLSEPDREAMEMAFSALEKQIPKKPNKIQSKNNKNLWNLYCPSCENWIGMWYCRLKRGDMHNISNGNICSYCGQNIEWEGN